MSKDLGLAVAAGLVSGLIFLSVMTGGMVGLFLSYLVPLPLLVTGLTSGPRHLMLASVIGLGTVGIVLISAVIGYGLFAVLPAVFVGFLALLKRVNAAGTLEWLSIGSILGGLVIVALALLIGVAVISMSHGGIEREMGRYVAEFSKDVAIPPEIWDELSTLVVAWVPGMAMAMWLTMAVMNGLLGEYLVARNGWTIRPMPVLSTLELPRWMPFALAGAALVGSSINGDIGYFGRNATLLLIVPFVFAGLSEIHRLAHRLPNAKIMLVLFYGIFFILFGWAQLAVAGLGLVRHWTRPRHNAAGQEEK